MAVAERVAAAGARAAAPQSQLAGFVGHVTAFFQVLRISRERGAIALFAAGIAVVVLATAYAQVRLNRWQGTFYEAINRHDEHTFMMQLGVFAAIVAVLTVLNVAQTWLQEILKIRLRAGLTRDMLDQWLKPQQAYRLALLGEIGVNPDQRLQEDARHLSELTAALAIGLFQASVLLVSFVGVLWILSDRVRFQIGGELRTIPGYMVWCAVLYALAGTLLAWRVGRRLIPLNEEHYAREADLRFGLVRVSEAAEGIALYSGEPAERTLLDRSLERVLDVMRALANRLAGLTWVTASYGYVALVVPIIVASPGYFSGTLNFGELMMVVGAFNQVQSSLRWWVDNLPSLADWRATFQRVMALYDAFLGLATLDKGRPSIKIDQPRDHIRLANLAIEGPGGTVRLDQESVEVAPGTHVQIVGGSVRGEAMLFRVLAGLWNAGSGTVELPDRHDMMFMPQRPYLPPGTLAQVVSYPDPPDKFDRQVLTDAIKRTHQDHLLDSFDQTRRWDHELSLVEQHAVAFARLLVHKPKWLVMDGVLETLEGRIDRVAELLRTELKETGILSIDAGEIDHDLFVARYGLVLEPAQARGEDTSDHER